MPPLPERSTLEWDSSPRLSEDLKQGRVQPTIRNGDIRAAIREGATVEIRDLTARFPDNDFAGGSVPRPQRLLPERIKPSRGDRTKVQRGRAGSAYGAGAPHDPDKKIQRPIHCFPGIREAGREQSALHVTRHGDPNGVAVQVRPRFRLRGEQFFPDRVENRAGDDFRPFLVGDGNGENRKSVGEVGRSVERIPR